VSEWPIRRVDQIAEVNPSTKLAKGLTHPFVPMDVVTPGLRYVRPNQARELTGGARFCPGDTLMARITPCLENGKIAQYDPDGKPGFGSTEYIVLRTRPDLADPAFLFYLALSPTLTEPAIGSMSGASGRQRADAKVVAATEFACPPIETQRRIAGILGAYDDLIEVNRRRVAVLEDMARGLFEEWFVRLRFPGHESVPLHNTPDGPLPEGWSWERIGDVSAYVNRGIAPKYDESVETLVIGQKCIRDQRLSLVLARRQSKKVPAEKVVQAGDILINSTGVGTLGRVAQSEAVPAGLTVDSHVTIVRPACAADRDYLGMQLLKMQPVFEHLGAGSTGQTELARGAVQDQIVIWADVALRARYGLVVRPMRELIDQLMIHNQRLAASRDLLLPRLMSGGLSVAEAQKELEIA
jgi:type I restriction enzyme S subunit